MAANGRSYARHHEVHTTRNARAYVYTYMPEDVRAHAWRGGGTERQRSDEGRSRTPFREAPAEHTSLERRALVYVGVTAFQLARRRRSDLEVAREHPSSTLRPRKFQRW